MIVVIGSPYGRRHGGDVRAGGVAATIAIAAAAHGRAVQLVGRIGDDPTADAVLRDLAGHGVGHVAVLRDAAHPTPIESAEIAGSAGETTGRLELEPEDVELALRYLTDFAVVAVVGAAGDVLSVVERAATWGAATLIVVDGAPTAQAAAADTLAAAGIRLAPSAGERSEAFAARAGEHLARLDAATGSVRSAR